jgi:thiamine kinase-like enzyme
MGLSSFSYILLVMILDAAISELETALHQAGIFFEGNLQLASNTNNVSFTDYSTIFVKVLGQYETNPKFLTQEHYVSMTHSKIMKPLLSSPLTVHLSDGDKLFVTAYNYVPHLFKPVSEFTEYDGVLIGAELVDFYDTQPLSPLKLNVNWSAKKALDSMDLFDVPFDISLTINYLADIAMDWLQECARKKNVDDKVLIHGDPHAQNMLWTADHVVRLIDLESVKYEYVECDLACLYQSFVQINNRPDVFDNILMKVEEAYTVDTDLLNAYIQARNVTATSFMCRTGNWNVVEQNLKNIRESLHSGDVVQKLYLPA